MLNIVFPRPCGFDRHADRFRDLDRIADEIAGGAASEAASHVHGMHVNLLGFETGELDCGSEDDRLHLGGCPDMALVRTHVGGAVERLHGSVREEGRLVNSFHFLGGAFQAGVDVAHFFAEGTRRQRFVGEHLRDGGSVDGGVRAFIPFDVEKTRGLDGGPGVIGNDGHAAGNGNDLLNAGEGAGCACCRS